ncbi:MAG: hypothetical protein WB780_24450 [Candidatus Acidiferrales bacterium]
MTDYMVFANETEAVAHLGTLRGWPDKATDQAYLPDNPVADEQGNVWVITPAEGKYLRKDGFVR